MAREEKIWVFHCLLMLQCYLGYAVVVVEKEEMAMPLTTMAPPEGNTTFLDGTTWCVARPGVPQHDLQNALDWACGLGKTDCGPILQGSPCFEPDNLLSHASFAFNSYYQQNGNSDIACNFGGTASLTKSDPSYGKCIYEASRSVAPTLLAKNRAVFMWWNFVAFFLLLYWRS